MISSFMGFNSIINKNLPLTVNAQILESQSLICYSGKSSDLRSGLHVRNLSRIGSHCLFNPLFFVQFNIQLLIQRSDFHLKLKLFDRLISYFYGMFILTIKKLQLASGIFTKRHFCVTSCMTQISHQPTTTLELNFRLFTQLLKSVVKRDFVVYLRLVQSYI